MRDNSTDTTPAWRLFLIFLRLGLTSFGGPIAHLGYFHEEFVKRRRWLGEDAYADLVALCQFLPGPASSQVGMAVGLMRGGQAGALAAWVGFTAPSAVLMTLFALGIARYDWLFSPEVLHGMRIVAVAVVAQAVLGMAGKLCADTPRILIMAAAAVIVLFSGNALVQVAVIAGAACLGLALFRHPSGAQDSARAASPAMSRSGGIAHLLAFVVLLLALPLLARWSDNRALAVADSFYRAGSLVFGGGNVILPLLRAEVAAPGWVSDNAFLAGYAAAQAMPGPLLSFAAFLGTAMREYPNGIVGGALCLAAIFAPSFFLIVGALPFWDGLRRNRRVQSALIGVNAAVVGLLLAAFYQPVWTNAIAAPKDFALGLLCWVALAVGKFPPWLVVVLGATANFAVVRLAGM